MRPLFKIDPACTFPIPVLRTDSDGHLRESDGKMFLELDQAAAASGRSEAELLSHWRSTLKDLLVEQQTVTDLDSGDIAEVDIESLSDADVAERIEKRRRGNFAADEWIEFKQHAAAMGYSIDKRECYPKRIVNEDTGETQVIAIAKIEALEDRVLRSGVYDGMEGPWYRGREGGEWLESWPHEKPPHEAKIIMHRVGVGRPLRITATWAEYAKFPDRNIAPSANREDVAVDRFWWFKGAMMLVKCLRARGYRELFRDFVGKVFIEEEFRGPTGGNRDLKRAADVTDDVDAHSLRVERDEDGNGAAATIAPRTLPMLRSQLALLGIGFAEQEHRITEARRLAPDDEAADPEAFYTAIYAKAVQERRSRPHIGRRARHSAG